MKRYFTSATDPFGIDKIDIEIPENSYPNVIDKAYEIVGRGKWRCLIHNTVWNYKNYQVGECPRCKD